MGNYFVYHLHSHYSSCTTNIDSVTKEWMYVDRAKELGMTALCFSEHGNIHNWYKKKTLIEKAGMKYVHGIEMYVTESLEEKVRDNYHVVMIAKNYDGVKEINKLLTKANKRPNTKSALLSKDEVHYYYAPRITLDELTSISNNIIITTACLAGPLGKGNDFVKRRMIEWMLTRPTISFLEIQHHDVDKQIVYNRELYKIHLETGLPLIAGTDTHNLNQQLAEARVLLQKGKNIFFDDEVGWDLNFKTYDELVEAYKRQGSLPMDVVMEAIENTNILESMVEEFTLDKSPKYPKLYEDSENELRKQAYAALDAHPYAKKNHKIDILESRIEEELEVYKKTNTIDFILFQKYVRDWERAHGVFCGPGRGSVCGSMLAYLFNITTVDSIKFKLEIWRFLNKDRISLGDWFDILVTYIRNDILKTP